MSLTFESEIRDDLAIIRLSGVIDRDAGSGLNAAFAAAGNATAVEFEFSDVEYINSSGIALIVGVLARARAGGKSLRAAGLTPHYQHIFEITRLSDFIDVVQPAGQ